ncbi:MAG: hypothetical protein ACK4M3_04265, partial [Pyrobaculum sp.]
SHNLVTYANVKMITITYITQDGVDKVASWFENYLAADRWQVISSSVSDGAKTLVAIKERAMIDITISPKVGYTEIKIGYQSG